MDREGQLDNPTLKFAKELCERIIKLTKLAIEDNQEREMKGQLAAISDNIYELEELFL